MQQGNFFLTYKFFGAKGKITKEVKRQGGKKNKGY
jgi:hypothetical protein